MCSDILPFIHCISFVLVNNTRSRFASPSGEEMVLTFIGTTSSTTSSTTTNSGTTATSQHATQTSSGASGSVASGSHAASQSQQSQSSVSVNPVDAPGGVTMLTPAATLASSTFYKIGATITFSWSYTSVQVTPSQIALQAYCATNKYFIPWDVRD
jgi:hypothetical protein